MFGKNGLKICIKKYNFNFIRYYKKKFIKLINCLNFQFRLLKQLFIYICRKYEIQFFLFKDPLNGLNCPSYR